MIKPTHKKTYNAIRQAGWYLKENFKNTTEFYAHAKKFFDINVNGEEIKFVGIKPELNKLGSDTKDYELLNHVKNVINKKGFRGTEEERILHAYNIARLYLESIAAKVEREALEAKQEVEKSELIKRLKLIYPVLRISSIHELSKKPINKVPKYAALISLEEYISAQNYQDDLKRDARKGWVKNTLEERVKSEKLEVLSESLSSISDEYNKSSNYLKEHGNKILIEILKRSEESQFKDYVINKRFPKNFSQTISLKKMGKLDEIIEHICKSTDWRSALKNIQNHPYIIEQYLRQNLPLENFSWENIILICFEIAPIEDALESFNTKITPKNISLMQKNKLTGIYSYGNVERAENLVSQYISGIKDTKVRHLHPRVCEAMLFAIENRDNDLIEKLRKITPLAKLINY